MKRKISNLMCNKTCIDCVSCLPIGEGDHLCDETQEIVISAYEPTEYYFCCKGEHFIDLRE